MLLDKPLSRRVWTLRDKHDLLYKYAGLAAGVMLAAGSSPYGTKRAPNGSAGMWRRNSPLPAAQSHETRFDLWRVGEDLDLVVRSRIHACQYPSSAAAADPAEVLAGTVGGGTGHIGGGSTSVMSGIVATPTLGKGGAASAEGGEAGIPLVIRGKAEYLGDPGRSMPEEATLLEHARRWASKTFHVGAKLLVGSHLLYKDMLEAFLETPRWA